ncbi:hypothetical protein GO499_18875 [Algicella marina]|uniref:Fenitrothion hydrolase n=2 Tax=Algicella marina TaxID=2683284 RepID=A0A6P1T6Z0_9RHOB|nr:hypothetical protein GO499_18875 [Algicella marina]
MASPVTAHVSEQAFVLLLPTDAYIACGLVIVLATLAFLAFSRPRMPVVPADVSPASLPRAAHYTSLAATALLFLLLWLGITGPRDPLSNLLPLSIWSGFWIFLVVLQGFVGNLWGWINPWRAIASLTAPDHIRPIPGGPWPACVILLIFFSFSLADPAPDDPDRLARITGGYWLFTYVGTQVFGTRTWLTRCEVFTVMMSLFARLSVNQSTGPSFPGNALLAHRTQIATGLFALLLLGAGSFDGLNETFWWLARIGVNPLEFPGRSALILPTTLGLAATCALLLTTFTACAALGHLIANKRKIRFFRAWSLLAVTTLPIAFGYHIAHYLPAALVNGQYLLAALSDPLATGADLLNLGTFYVTTGFFNTTATVRIIWLTQAAAVVAGHVLSLVLAHRAARMLYGSDTSALRSQIPLSLFMVAYTLLGLWLLAAPKGA